LAVISGYRLFPIYNCSACAPLIVDAMIYFVLSLIVF